MKVDPLDRCVSEAYSERAAAAHRIGPGGQDKCAVLVVEDEGSMDSACASFFPDCACLSSKKDDVKRHCQYSTQHTSTLPFLITTSQECMEQKPAVESAKILPRLPTLMLSVANDEDQELEAFQAGANDYILKPFRHRKLVARLDAAIRRARLCSGYGEVSTVGDLSLDYSLHLGVWGSLWYRGSRSRVYRPATTRNM